MTVLAQTIPTVIYAQATDEEGDEVLQLQVDAMKDWCAVSRGGPGTNVRAAVVAVFTDICPATQTDRPGLRAAIKTLRETGNSLLVVWSMQRLGRSVKQIASVMTQVAGTGRAFYELTTLEPVNDTTVAAFKSLHYQFMEGLFEGD